MNAAAGLVAQNLRKVFFPRTINEVVALNDINLEVNPGDFVTVIGSNGSGKSTLLNAIAGTRPGDRRVPSGSRAETSRSVPEYLRARSVGRVFQDPRAGTAPSMSIQENMAMAYMRGRRRSLRPGVPAKLKKRYEGVAGRTRHGPRDSAHQLR